MPYLFALILLLIVLIFSLSSMSEAYVVAKQAEAVVAANHTAQLTSATNIVLVLVIALLVVGIFSLLGFILYLKFRQPGAPRTGSTQMDGRAKRQMAVGGAFPHTCAPGNPDGVAGSANASKHAGLANQSFPHPAQLTQPDDEEFAWPME